MLLDSRKSITCKRTQSVTFERDERTSFTLHSGFRRAVTKITRRYVSGIILIVNHVNDEVIQMCRLLSKIL